MRPIGFVGHWRYLRRSQARVRPQPPPVSVPMLPGLGSESIGREQRAGTEPYTESNQACAPIPEIPTTATYWAYRPCPKGFSLFMLLHGLILVWLPIPAPCPCLSAGCPPAPHRPPRSGRLSQAVSWREAARPCQHGGLGKGGEWGIGVRRQNLSDRKGLDLRE